MILVFIPPFSSSSSFFLLESCLLNPVITTVLDAVYVCSLSRLLVSMPEDFLKPIHFSLFWKLLFFPCFEVCRMANRCVLRLISIYENDLFPSQIMMMSKESSSNNLSLTESPWWRAWFPWANAMNPTTFAIDDDHHYDLSDPASTSTSTLSTVTLPVEMTSYFDSFLEKYPVLHSLIVDTVDCLDYGNPSTLLRTNPFDFPSKFPYSKLSPVYGVIYGWHTILTIIEGNRISNQRTTLLKNRFLKSNAIQGIISFISDLFLLTQSTQQQQQQEKEDSNHSSDSSILSHAYQLPRLEKLLETCTFATIDIMEEDDYVSELDYLVFHSAWLYLRLLKIDPLAVRHFLMESRDRGGSRRVEKWTELYFSPGIIQHELDLVVQNNSFSSSSTTLASSFSLNAHRALREVIMKFHIEDVQMELVLRLPTLYPLRPIEIIGVQRVGITEGQWRKWLLSMTAFLNVRMDQSLML